jgi:anhydro-N-acetylmuramic acid kinase
MSHYYIGLISGTSIDGIDAVLVEFGDRSVRVISANTCKYPAELAEQLLAVTRQPQDCTPDVLGMLDHWVGKCFRDAALQLLEKSGSSPNQVRAIGSHGQTIRHQPDADRPFTLQIGDANLVAKGTGIDCVADFRRADMALGGQGAPLVPPFHDWLFRDDKIERCVLNLGGIANVTLLPAASGKISGFDTGPGNTLMDAWARRHRDARFDAGGEWAASGTSDEALLERMAADPYFAKAPPKSTGFEYFNETWLSSFLRDDKAVADVQSTLCDLTATTVVSAINASQATTAEVLVCGGGVHNTELLSRIAALLPGAAVSSTADYGLDPDWVEACAFAWLAKRTLDGEPGNAPAVTGASRQAVLGGVYPAG